MTIGGDQYDGCNEQLVLTRPDLIQDIHENYLAAGADIVGAEDLAEKVEKGEIKVEAVGEAVKVEINEAKFRGIRVLTVLLHPITYNNSTKTLNPPYKIKNKQEQ